MARYHIDPNADYLDGPARYDDHCTDDDCGGNHVHVFTDDELAARDKALKVESILQNGDENV